MHVALQNLHTSPKRFKVQKLRNRMEIIENPSGLLSRELALDK